MSNSRSKPTVERRYGAKSKALRIIMSSNVSDWRSAWLRMGADALRRGPERRPRHRIWNGRLPFQELWKTGGRAIGTARIRALCRDEMADLFSSGAATASDNYDASAIEVLEGLEPVRRRPGMYIGGTDARALHHLAAEVIDNAMDEAVAGFASRIEVELDKGNRLTVIDNGRGIPVDPHPRFPGKSALEVIMTTLHSGGKFEGKAYSTSGGLHGVGVSVVNALSTETIVEVARDRTLYRQAFARGIAISHLETVGAAPNRRGTTVSFTPDPEIFGEGSNFSPERLY